MAFLSKKAVENNEHQILWSSDSLCDTRIGGNNNMKNAKVFVLNSELRIGGLDFPLCFVNPAALGAALRSESWMSEDFKNSIILAAGNWKPNKWDLEWMTIYKDQATVLDSKIS